jgi:hypothetical protein
LPLKCNGPLTTDVLQISIKFYMLFALLAVVFNSSGCAIRYHDARAGTEHIWGFAHIKVRPATIPAATSTGAAPAVAVATQVETFGMGLGINTSHSAQAIPGDAGFSLGWNRRTRVFLSGDATLELEWPSLQLFDVRVGPPPSAPSPPCSAASVGSEPSQDSAL